MKSTPLTQGASTLILAIYLIHTFMTSPLVTVLIALAGGIIAYGFLESVELAAAFTIVSGVLFSLVNQTKFSYESKITKEAFSNDTTEQIAHRVQGMQKTKGEPSGVLASSFAEGFADATTDNSGNDVTSHASSGATSGETKAAPATTSGGAGSGVPPATPPAAAKEVAKAAPAKMTSGAGSGAQPAAAKDMTKAGFTGSTGKDMEFKLGVIPDDGKGGYHIDQGTTVINALNALKPDQIKSMTEDTRKLIDTQKNLMSMLGSMKPMLQDGKQMMVNFQEMFGNGADPMKV